MHWVPDRSTAKTRNIVEKSNLRRLGQDTEYRGPKNFGGPQDAVPLMATPLNQGILNRSHRCVRMNLGSQRIEEVGRAPWRGDKEGACF